MFLSALKNLFSRAVADEVAIAETVIAPVALPDIEGCGILEGKRVLLRAPLNVPVKDGAVENAFRLQTLIPTINILKEKGARIILLGHIGRDQSQSLRPVYEALEQLIPLQGFIPLTGDETQRSIENLQNGEVIMLENVRSHEGEQANDAAFAKLLASYGDFYVNDAFADSHRAHASVVGIPALLPSCFGLSFIQEYEALTLAMRPQSPSLFILGGAKFETKLPLIEKYLAIYDHVFIGGALANDFFKAKGLEVGVSLVSDSELNLETLFQNERLLLPVDVTVKGESGIRESAPEEVRPDENMLDVGPLTIEMLRPYVEEAKTILWNGPVGNYEGGFSAYTESCAKLISENDAYSVIGGGDTIAAIESLQLENKFGFLSTAGGAMLVFLESGTLPGIDAILTNR
jgi:phosphoglycerate kinase